MPAYYLIYHPARKVTTFRNFKVYHDQFGGNEDPYIWNEKFLHTYCHITQLSNDIGQTNFWISGDSYPNFTKLFCYCVFVIAEKHYWTNRNHIDRFDSIVDNTDCWEHHYKWANTGEHHQYLRRRRYTLKADSHKSFQPQTRKGELLDITPFLNSKGITTEFLIDSMTSKRGSRPCQLSEQTGKELYDYLFSASEKKLFGKQLKNRHPHTNNITGNGCC